MGIRFRKSIKVLPGVRLNLSRSGVSASIGKPGATVNVGGRRGPRATIGIPGSGLSVSERLPTQPVGRMSVWRLLAWGIACLLAAIVVLGLLGKI